MLIWDGRRKVTPVFMYITAKLISVFWSVIHNMLIEIDIFRMSDFDVG